MTDVKSLFSSRFARFVVDTYAPHLRTVAPGHCLKLVGLTLGDLRQIVGPLRAENENVGVYILSDENVGPEFIRASKLVEMRNDPSKAILALIPANSRTAAEDSYGDSTFQVLNVASLQRAFFEKLRQAARQVNENFYERIANLLKQYFNPSPAQMADYLLFVEGEGYSAAAWGDGLFLFGMLPDSKLALVDAEETNRRFVVNLRQCANVMFDFSITPAERVSELRISDSALQSRILSYLLSSTKTDRLAMSADIYENHPEFNLEHWPIEGAAGSSPVKLSVDLKPGSDRTKELVRDSQGCSLLAFPAPDESGNSRAAKRKVALEVTCEPSPKDVPALSFYEVTLVKLTDFEEIGLVKNVPVGSSRRAKKKLTVTIESDDGIEEGQYLFRVRALDSNRLPIESDNPFKSDSVEQKWQEVRGENPDKDAFRRKEMVLFSNETESFTLIKGDDDFEIGSPAKRERADALFLAHIDRKIQLLMRGADSDSDEPVNINSWTCGKLNDTLQLDFGMSFHYKLSVPCKLKNLEASFYGKPGRVGCVSAKLSADRHAAELLDLDCQSLEGGEGPYRRLCELREKLFSLIRGSVGDREGLFCTFDVMANIDLVRDYIAAYDAWLKEAAAVAGTDAASALLHADIVRLLVEMPDGSHQPVMLIPPIHPLRLAWAACLCELFNDWRERTADGGADAALEWKNRLASFFRGGLSPDVAPLILVDGQRRRLQFQYSGEIAFGWGAYALAGDWSDESPYSDSRQMTAYVASLLNVGRGTSFDSDMDVRLVARQIKRYVAAHPYADKLSFNIFNAGDGCAFADALVFLQDDCGAGLSYEVRLFSAESLVKPGAAFRDLVAPEAPVSEVAAPFALQPKLRFSVNDIKDFIDRPTDYPAHMSFLVNPFKTKVAIASPDRQRGSFFLNGALCRGLSCAIGSGNSFMWNRYFSNKPAARALSGAAVSEAGIFASLQSLAAAQISSTPGCGVPASSLVMTGREAMLVDKVHEVSDWVVTFDKNMGPEFYDRCDGGHYPEPDADSVDADAGSGRMPYLLDFVPGEDSYMPTAFLSSRAQDEIMSVLLADARCAGLDLGERAGLSLIDDVRAVSASVLFPSGGDDDDDTVGRSDVVPLALAKRLLHKMSVLDEAFLIPLGLHAQLAHSDEPMANLLLVNMDPRSRNIRLTAIDARCGKCASAPDKVWLGMAERIDAAVDAMRSLFAVAGNARQRLGGEVDNLVLSDLLSFYLSRAIRFNLINKDVADLYLEMIDSLDEGYSLSFRTIALAFNTCQMERVGHAPISDGDFFSFGLPALCDLLSDEAEAASGFNECTAELYGLFEHNIDELVDFRQAEVELQAREEAAAAASEPAKLDEIPAPLATSDNGADVSPVPAVPPAAPLDDVADPYGLMLGSSVGSSRRFAVVGNVARDGGASVCLDFSTGNVISLFGIRGSGVDGSLATIVDAALSSGSRADGLSGPLAGVFFSFCSDPDSVPSFASLLQTRAERGASSKSVGLSDVLLLTPKDLVDSRRVDYPGVDVRPLTFASNDFGVKDWMWLLGAEGADAAYVKQVRQILKACKGKQTLCEIAKSVDYDASIAEAHKTTLRQRLELLTGYVDDSAPLAEVLRPGRLVVVDLCDEYIEDYEALSIFAAMMGAFSNANMPDGRRVNKIMAFAEADTYMNSSDLASSLASAIDAARLKGVSAVISSHLPASLPTAVVESSSVVILHRLTHPSWLDALQAALEPLRRLSASDVAGLAPGEAYVWAGSAAGVAAAEMPARVVILRPGSGGI